MRKTERLTETPNISDSNVSMRIVDEIFATVHISSAVATYYSTTGSNAVDLTKSREHNSIWVYCALAGTCVLLLKDRDLALDGGDIGLLLDEDSHIIRAEPATKLACLQLYYSDDFLANLRSLLPPVIKILPPKGPESLWIRASILYISVASGGEKIDPPSILLRLSELLLIHALRCHLTSNPTPTPRWLLALNDPIVRQALAEIHAHPAHRWSVEELAKHIPCSRSTLTERFGKLLGMGPIHYLNRWRLQIAADMLLGSGSSVSYVAHQVGYESEEGFNRAFKKAMGIPPAQWRRRAQHV